MSNVSFDEYIDTINAINSIQNNKESAHTNGKNHSDADCEDKTAWSQNSCVGKPCDFLYWSSSREAGIGENSRPTHKDNHDKVRTDFVDVIKVCRAQHIKLVIQIIEQNLPMKDADMGEIALLCKRFLVHRYLIEHVGQMTNILAKKSKTLKDKITGASKSSQSTVKLNKFRTPVKEKKSAK
nr:13252_t:CDS:2 [Entrophospora candida]